MALPSSPAEGKIGGLNGGAYGRVGPFISSAGAVYFIGHSRTTEGKIVAMKAADPTEDANWTEQDSANSPTISGDIEGDFTGDIRWWTEVEGDTIHMVSQNVVPGGMAGNTLQALYSQFSMATDSWIRTEVVVDTPIRTTGQEPVSIVVRSNGDLIAAYNDEVVTIMGTDYNRLSYAKSTDGGATWSAPNALDGGGEFSYSTPVAVLGDSDRVHFLYRSRKIGTQTRFHHRSLSSADVLDTQQTLRSDPTDSAFYFPGPAAAFDDGAGGVTVRALYRPNSELVEFPSQTDPTFSFTAAPDNSLAAGQTLWPTLANGTDQHIMYIPAADDIFRDVNTGDGWGVDEQVTSVGNIEELSANIIDRNGVKIAFLYQNTSDVVFYDEISLEAEPEPEPDAAAPGYASIRRRFHFTAWGP